MHPVAFQFGALTVTWYGILVAVAFLAGLWTASRRAPLSGLSSDIILDLGPWLIIGAIVGARVLYIVTFWREQFAGRPVSELFMVWHGGLVFYGGFIGATLAAILWAKLKKIPMWKMGDVVAPSIALGYAIGRLGCLLNGCCYGKECALPWAIHFPQGHESYPHGVHPTELYDACWGLLLYAFLARLYRRKTFDGQAFAAFLVGYAVLRFSVELLRGDYPADQLFLGGRLTPAQIVSLGILPVGLLLWWLLPRPGPGTKPEGSLSAKPLETGSKRR